MDYKFKKITVIIGYYGTGKTNLAVNAALWLKKYGSVSVVDLDIVNPYFRTADFKELFCEKGITPYYPRYAGTNLDTPVLEFDMEGIIASSDHTVIDVGGDSAGAYALGGYRHIFKRYAEDTDVLYVFSSFRREGFSPQEVADNMREIENACGLKCTALVNNSNLGSETDYKTVSSSAGFGKELEKLTGLETAFVCVPDEGKNNKEFTVKRYVRLPWERDRI